MRVHILQHVEFEGPGHIAQWARTRNHTIAITRLFKGEPLPKPSAVDLLVLMGGPMSIDEHQSFPWLVEEKRYIKKCIENEIRVIGICLGAQLIADALGGEVLTAPHREIGWYPIDAPEVKPKTSFLDCFPFPLTVLHWHGDTFTLPQGCELLASSKACMNQAFSYANRVLGLQFHLESTPATVESLLSHCQDELHPGESVQQAETIRTQNENVFSAMHRVLENLLDRLSSQTV